MRIAVRTFYNYLTDSLDSKLYLLLSTCDSTELLTQSFRVGVLVFCADTVVEGPIAVPHLVPLLMAMEGEDPVENSERGCQLLYNILQSARNAAVHAPDYQQHAHSLLTGGCA